jgi:hypothetical protein
MFCRLHHKIVSIFYSIEKGRGASCDVHGQIWNTYRLKEGKPEGKRPLTSPRCRWKYIKWVLKEWDTRAWNGFSELRIMFSGGIF